VNFSKNILKNYLLEKLVLLLRVLFHSFSFKFSYIKKTSSNVWFLCSYKKRCEPWSSRSWRVRFLCLSLLRKWMCRVSMEMEELPLRDWCTAQGPTLTISVSPSWIFCDELTVPWPPKLSTTLRILLQRNVPCDCRFLCFCFCLPLGPKNKFELIPFLIWHEIWTKDQKAVEFLEHCARDLSLISSPYISDSVRTVVKISWREMCSTHSGPSNLLSIPVLCLRTGMSFVFFSWYMCSDFNFFGRATASVLSPFVLDSHESSRVWESDFTAIRCR
jgi:hypothetical protein